MPATAPSLLQVVARADNFPGDQKYDYFPTFHPTLGEKYIPFHLTSDDYYARLEPVGLIRPEILAELQADAKAADASGPCSWDFILDDDGQVRCVCFADQVVAGGRDAMSSAIQDIAERWRDEGKFAGTLKAWRYEKARVYASKESSALKGVSEGLFENHAFALERCALALFGLGAYGVHLTAYEGEGNDLKIWVPRRSATKKTYPGMLDNTVAGGIPAGLTPIEAMVKECDEEADLSEAFVRAQMRSTGLLSYLTLSSQNFLKPQALHCFDLPLPPRSSPDYVKPQPHDDEVESFELLSVPQVMQALYNGEFKPNSGLVLVDFLVRHGFVTSENEPDYVELIWRMHRRLAVAMPA